MDNLFDIIGPVGFILFLAIGKLLEVAMKGKGEQNPGGQPHRSRPTSQSGDANEVQEKIRRLIRERAGIEVDVREEADGFGERPEPKRFSYEEPQPIHQAPEREVTPIQPPRPSALPSPLRHSTVHHAYSNGSGKRAPSKNMKSLGLDKPGNLKRAFLLKEILDAPLALRQDRRETW
jgi:hypothetical protein